MFYDNQNYIMKLLETEIPRYRRTRKDRKLLLLQDQKMFSIYSKVHYSDTVRFGIKNHILPKSLLYAGLRINFKLVKEKALRKHSLHEKTTASVLLKLFISSNE